MDRITSLSVFTAAVELGSLAAAARRCKMTPAMAGRHLESLERSLNARLLQRTTRRLNLTDVGRAYYQRSRRMLEEFEEAQREAGDLQASPQGLLRIAVPASFGALHLGGPLARYMRDHPGIRVQTMVSDRYVDLVQEGIDLAIRIGRLPDSNLVARHIGTCRMVLCAAPSYLRRAGVPTTPQELARHHRLAFSDSVSPGDWTLRDTRGRHHVIDGPCQLLADNVQLLLAVALEAGGIVYGPTFVFGDALYRRTLVRVLPRYSASDLGIHTVVPSSRYLSTKVRHLIDQLATEFGEAPPWDRWRETEERGPRRSRSLAAATSNSKAAGPSR
jgi:DNA-binding transcriptional LysR family regulator